MSNHLSERASAILTVDLDAILANYRTLCATAHPARCAAVVKADAYGLGAIPVAKALMGAGCREFFVAMLGEGIALRDALGDGPDILILNGLPPDGERTAQRYGLTPVLNSLAQCKAWADAGGGASVLQVDTGMSRLGLSADEFSALIADKPLLNRLDLRLLMSHLANADTPEHPANRAQLETFTKARDQLPHIPAALANSAGIFLGKDYHFDLCRPGAALYGLDVGPNAPPLAQPVNLAVRLIQTRSVPSGTGIGYGHTHLTTSDMQLATIATGYADGWFRAFSGTGGVWWKETFLPIVGRVSMDSTIIDISALAAGTLRAGAYVELIGPHQTPDDLARTIDTIGYEILTNLGTRYARQYILNGKVSS